MTGPVNHESKSWLRVTPLRVLAFSLLLFGSAAGYAQEAHRKLKSGNPPEYPELARKMHIQGVARVEVTILANGAVDNVKEVGGNPVLLDALVRAVRKWRYESAERESVVEVQFEFKSS